MGDVFSEKVWFKCVNIPVETVLLENSTFRRSMMDSERWLLKGGFYEVSSMST